jgi:hypothetical protein
MKKLISTLCVLFAISLGTNSFSQPLSSSTISQNNQLEIYVYIYGPNVPIVGTVYVEILNVNNGQWMTVQSYNFTGSFFSVIFNNLRWHMTYRVRVQISTVFGDYDYRCEPFIFDNSPKTVVLPIDFS